MASLCVKVCSLGAHNHRAEHLGLALHRQPACAAIDPADPICPFFNAIKPLLKLLRSGHDDAPMAAEFALGHIARKSSVLHACVIGCDAVPEFVELIWTLIGDGKATGFEMQGLLFTLGELAKPTDFDKNASRATTAIPVLLELLRSEDSDGAMAAVSAMKKLAEHEEVKTALIDAGAVVLLGELLLTQSHGGRDLITQLLWQLKFKSDVERPDVIRKAAELFFAAASKERRAAKARIRELESENDDLKRKLPAEIRG